MDEENACILNEAQVRQWNKIAWKLIVVVFVLNVIVRELKSYETLATFSGYSNDDRLTLNKGRE